MPSPLRVALYCVIKNSQREEGEIQIVDFRNHKSIETLTVAPTCLKSSFQQLRLAIEKCTTAIEVKDSKSTYQVIVFDWNDETAKNLLKSDNLLVVDMCKEIKEYTSFLTMSGRLQKVTTS